MVWQWNHLCWHMQHFHIPLSFKTKDFKVTTSKVGTWTFCLVKPIHFTFMKLWGDSGIIYADICNISTFLCPSKPRISKSLPQKWVLEHSDWWNLFISLLWNYGVIVESSMLTFATFHIPLSFKTKDFKVTTSKVGTWTFCLVKPIHVTFMKLWCDSGIICADICNISTYLCPPKPRISKSLPQSGYLNIHFTSAT